MPRWLVPAFAVCLLSATGRAADPRGLDVYFIDTEGGAATLIVTPAGESVLIDCGNPGTRDAERIHKAATELAGLKAIDHLVITHWHADHYGGVNRLSKLMPIRAFYDRGIPDKLADDTRNFPTLIDAYKTASGGKSTALKPGDELKLKQSKDGPPISIVCLCANYEVVPERPGAKPNPVAKEHKAKAEDKTDNARSLGFLIRYGDWRFLDLGDLTWNIEHKLVSPSDRIGTVDVYLTTHHGQDSSNNPVVMKTVKPTVAIFNNGAAKGCHPEVLATLRRIDEVKAIYQLHKNTKVGASENTDPEFIANAEEKCQGESIRMNVSLDGKSYSIAVGGKGKPRTYKTRDHVAGKD